MPVNTLPTVDSGWLILGEGRDIVLNTPSGGWSNLPLTLYIDGTSYGAPTITDEYAIWSLTKTQVSSFASDADKTVPFWITAGSGDKERSVVVGELTIVSQGFGKGNNGANVAITIVNTSGGVVVSPNASTENFAGNFNTLIGD